MAGTTVFISYSRKQFYIAEQLARIIEQNGLAAWIDVQEIAPGSDWQASIDQGLAACHAFVVLASRSAQRSAAVQYEIAAARKAGKPIYLAVIEDCPLVAELRDVTTVIDCHSQFSASAKTLAQAIQGGKHPPQQALRRTNPLSQQIPFGRAKYRQLIWLNLCFLLGTGAILLRKQIVVHTPLNPRLDPYLVLATIPVVLWVLSFAYSLILLVAFRRQRRVTYLELELWPVISIFVWPILFDALTFLATEDSGSNPGTGFGSYFNAYLAIFNRAYGDPTLPWQIVLLFGGYGMYLLFLAFTMRGWLLAFGLIPVIAIFSLSVIPAPIRLLTLLVVGGGIAFLSMRGFLSGRDVPVAFGERKAKYDVVHPGFADLIPWENLAWGFWLSPGAFPNEAFVSERLRLRSQSAPNSKGQAWRLHYVPADAGGARSLRSAFALYPELREVTDDQADYQITLLSNKTPRRWIDEIAGRYPQLICIILSSLDISSLDKMLQRNQWIDFRQQQREQIHYLARALVGLPDNVNPTTPENFVRPLGPHPVKLIVHALRMGGVASLVLGLAAQIINVQYHVAAAPVPLIVVSITLGVCGWWEAVRLLARNAFLPELLLTFGAILANLLYWVISAAFGSLLPREVFVHNGDYNNLLALILSFIAAFGGIPFLLFLLVAGIELVRNIETLRRWLPRAARPDWRRTLAVAPWRQLDFTYIFYPVAALALIATLVVDSPYRYPQVREFDMPSASMSPGNLLVGPDGNIWFDSGDDSSYDIGYITPAGQLQTRQIVTTEPAGCQSVSTLDCTMDGGDLQVGPDHNLWYVTHRIFPPYHYVIWRSTLAGAKTPFALPDDSTFAAIAFDGAGNLWYARATVHSQLGRNNQYFIGRMDNTGHITEFALPSQSVLATFEAGPDGNFWFFDDANNTVGKITPEGKLTQYRLPYPSKGAGLGHKEMIVGPDRNLWFADPQSGVTGRVTLKGAITLFTSGSDHFPQDLIAGPDGSVWFLDEGKANAIDRISPAGRLASYPLHALMSFHSSLTVGPDGNLWFTLYNQIGRITPEGVLKLYDVPTLDASLSGIVTGPDGHIWFGELAGLIGELTP